MHAKNLNRLRASIIQKLGNVHQASLDVIEDEAYRIMYESLDEVPKSTGTLASIAEVTKTVLKPTMVSIKIGYGITTDAYNEQSKMHASKYMLKVHEDLDANHPNGGKAKFLEDPINRSRQRIYAKLKAAGGRRWK